MRGPDRYRTNHLVWKQKPPSAASFGILHGCGVRTRSWSEFMDVPTPKTKHGDCFEIAFKWPVVVASAALAPAWRSEIP